MIKLTRYLTPRLMALCLIGAISILLFAQPPMHRRHTQTQLTTPLSTFPATIKVTATSQVQFNESASVRQIRSNGIPNHLVGPFPNRGNPNRIDSQRYEYQVARNPTESRISSPVAGFKFGVAVNGVPFDPGAAEFFLGRPSRDWQYEALAGVIPLGLDENYAHVQPGGQYHYHGLPTLLMTELNVNSKQHSPLVGWAADGFPIYALYGYKSPDDPDSEIVELKSSYQLKTGNRPSGNGNPGGQYDGTFVGDYDYQKLLGDLDECNARRCVTPEFPEGTFAYFLTTDWPVIPRKFRGLPSRDFQNGPGGPMEGPGERRGPPPERPPFGPIR